MKTVRGKITFWAELVLVLTIVIVTVSNVFYMGTHLLQKQKDELQANTDTYAEEINSKFANYKGLAQGTATTIEAMNTKNSVEIQSLIRNIYTNNPEILDIYYGDKNGNFIHANSTAVSPGYDPPMRPWYLQTLANDEITVINPYKDATTGEMCTTIAAPVKKFGKFIGCVGIDIPLSTIITMVDGISYADGSYGFLVDDDGNVVTHPDESMLPTEEGAVSVVADLPEVGMTKYAKTDVIEVQNYVGDTCYLAFSNISECDWTLITVIPTKYVKTVLRNATDLAGAVGLLVAAIVAIISFILLSRELSGITPMINNAKAIARGDFSSFELSHNNAEEIQKLQDAMNKMTTSMQQLVDEQKNVLEEVSRGNLAVQDMGDYPGEFDEISKSINSIKERLNSLISDLQFAAINLQSTAIGIASCIDPEEMQAVLEELLAEANDLMKKAHKFRTDID